MRTTATTMTTVMTMAIDRARPALTALLLIAALALVACGGGSGDPAPSLGY